MQRVYEENEWGKVSKRIVTRDMKEMEENVKNSLDDMPIVQIQW